jgi:hypothetical protein
MTGKYAVKIVMKRTQLKECGTMDEGQPPLFIYCLKQRPNSCVLLYGLSPVNQAI